MDTFQELKKEHGELPVNKENWLVKFKITKDQLDNHLEDEDNEIAPQSRQVYDKDRTEKFGKKYERSKEKTRERLYNKMTRFFPNYGEFYSIMIGGN